MPKGDVKKGFARYLLILLLIIVAAFLVTIVVMLFSPFKNILGFQYMVYNTSDRIFRTTADQPINFSTIEEINIDCNYSNVVIERVLKLDYDAIGIENNCKGFATSKDDTSFNCEVYFSDESNKILNIEVSEPKGFLFFDKEINIKIEVPATSNYSLENTRINIINTSGTINVGNVYQLSNNPSQSNVNNYLDINNLSIKTERGSIYLNEFLENELEYLFIKSSSGSTTFRHENMIINQSLEIHSKSGNTKIQNITYNGSNNNGLVFDLNNGKLNAYGIDGNIMLNINSGYLDIENLTGSLNANDSVVQMNNATITINNIDGDISLPFANDSKINIGTMTTNSQIYVRGNSSNVNVEELRGKAFIETKSGQVNIHSYSDDLDIKTQSGDINIIYESQTLNNQLNFKSETGAVNLSVLSQLAFALFAYDNNGNDSSNIYVEFQPDKFSNPLIINNGSKYINITTNGHISISFIY